MSPAADKRPLSPAQKAALEQHHFRKGGPSPNPGGRPKSIAALAREMSEDGATVLRFLLDVIEGREKADAKVRVEAAREVLNRAWGRSVEATVALSATAPASDETRAALAKAMDGMSSEELAALLRAPSPAPALPPGGQPWA